MENNLLKSSEQIDQKEILSHLTVVWKDYVTHWHNYQLFWLNNAYKVFNDIEKYMIVAFLVKKTFEFYTGNFKKYTFTEYYNGSKIEIENLSIIEISKGLQISKETARRKILELEKSGVFKRAKKKLVLDRSKINFQKPDEGIGKLSNFLSILSIGLFKNKILKHSFERNDIANFINTNFTYVWQLYLSMQLGFMLSFKNTFKDYEAWYIYGIILANQNTQFQKKISLKNVLINDREQFFKNLTNENLRGINAMSISEVTGIPRATVVRKLFQLQKKSLITADTKKLYLCKEINKELMEKQKRVLEMISKFASHTYSYMSFSN